VVLVRTEVSEECIASSMLLLLVTANVSSSPILVALMIETYVPPERWFLQELHSGREQ
jgi:hypothetical protein